MNDWCLAVTLDVAGDDPERFPVIGLRSVLMDETFEIVTSLFVPNWVMKDGDDISPVDRRYPGTVMPPATTPQPFDSDYWYQYWGRKAQRNRLLDLKVNPTEECQSSEEGEIHVIHRFHTFRLRCEQLADEQGRELVLVFHHPLVTLPHLQYLYRCLLPEEKPLPYSAGVPCVVQQMGDVSALLTGLLWARQATEDANLATLQKLYECPETELTHEAVEVAFIFQVLQGIRAGRILPRDQWWEKVPHWTHWLFD